MRPTVKICGLSTPETVEAAVTAGADMVGLNFFPPSPRHVDLDLAARLAAGVRGRSEVVAVTVDMDDAGLAAIVERVKPDWLQLHGKESPERVGDVRRRFGIRVMKAAGIREASDVAALAPYFAVADGLLLDAKPPKGAPLPGGNGVPFDWTILVGFDPGLPWLLSGGLGPDNVAAALSRTGAPGVDVSSGVESAPGRKEPSLIRAFVAAARAVERQPERIA